MKKILFFVICVYLLRNSNAATYYFSSSTGNDSYTIVQAQNPLTPWNSIDKLNKIMYPLIEGGDSILFKRGDVFYGSIKMNKSGKYILSINSNLLPKRIVLGAYGKGSLPEISGLKCLTAWEKISPNLWRAKCPKNYSLINNLLINGIPQSMGRYPNVDSKNGGFLTVASHIGKSKISFTEPTNNINWKGSQIIIKTNRRLIEKTNIKEQKNKTFTLSDPLFNEPLDGFGFFIQNNIGTLDQEGEWYYDSLINSIYLYLEKNPNYFTIQVSEQPVLINLVRAGILALENIVLNGASKAAILMNFCYDVQLKNVSIKNSAMNGFHAFSSWNIDMVDNYIYETNNNAIEFLDCKDILIKNNTIKNTGLRTGLGSNKIFQYFGMFLKGENYRVESNKIDSVGFTGIFFMCDSLIATKNFITNFCLNIDEGAGIYIIPKEKKINTLKQIKENSIINGRGSLDGTPFKDSYCSGIYVADNSEWMEIMNNNVLNCSFGGISIYSSKKIRIIGNLLSNNARQLFLYYNPVSNPYKISNLEVFNNSMFTGSSKQYLLYLTSTTCNISDIAKFNYNSYYNTAKEGNNIVLDYFGEKNDHRLIFLSLKDWQEKYLCDKELRTIPVLFDPLIINGLLSSNLILNEEFNDLQNWSTWSVYNNCEINLDNINKQLGLGLKFYFNSLSGKPDSKMYIIPNSISLKKGAKYLLYFSAKCSKSNTPIIINLCKAENTAVKINDPISVRLDTCVRNYQYIISTQNDEAQARLDFEIPESSDLFWLGNVELYEADISYLNPDDFILFKYNSQNQNDTISINGGYFDLNGNLYTNTLALKPYSFVALFRFTHNLSQDASFRKEFRLVKVLSKYWISKSDDIILLLMAVVAFFLFLYKKKKILLTGSIFILLLIAAWFFLSRSKERHKLYGIMHPNYQSLVINNTNYKIKDLDKIEIRIEGYKGQKLFPYRSYKNKTDGSNNYIKIVTKEGEKMNLRFQINKYTDISKIKEITEYWKFSGIDVKLSIAVEWI